MKMMRVFAALVAGAAMVFAPALMAQEAPATPKSDDKPAEKPKEPEKAPEKDGDKKEEPKEGDKKEEESAFALMFKGLADITGKIEFAEADMKAFIKDYPELDKITEADAKFKKLADTSLKEAFEYLVKNEKYLEWAKAKGVDADKYLRMTLRIMTTQIKVTMKEVFKLGEEGMESGRKQIEAMKDEMSAEEYKKALEDLEKSKKEFVDMKKAIEGIPGPSEAEGKLLEVNKKEIAKAMGQGEEATEDDAEDDEKEDGMGSK